MDSKEQKTLFSSYTKFVKYFFSAAVILLFIFFVLGQLLSPDERDVLSSNCQEFNPAWNQVLSNGNKIPITSPTVLDSEYGEKVTLTTTLPDNINQGECVCFRPVWQDVTIYVDGELKLDYNTDDSRPFGKNSPMRYVFVELSPEDSGKEMTYIFSSHSKYSGDIRSGFIGDRLSIWIHLMEDNGLHMLISIFLLTMSLFCIIVCVILRIVYKKSLPLSYLAWTLFFCALWMISEMSFRQLIFKNISILSCFTYWCLMIIPLPLITYINEIQEGRYKKIYFIPLVYSMVIMVLGTLLQVFDMVQFVSQLKFIHAGLLVSIICIIVTITIDAFKKLLSDYLAVGIGVYGMILTAIMEMVLYYVGTNLSLGTTLSVGLLFLLIMAIIKTGQDLLISENKKQQAISAKEAQTMFLANMSHEIRTPINAIIGMNEMILRENNNKAIEDYSHNIENASNMLLGLINDILDFTKIESGQLELVEDVYHLPTLINDESLILDTRVTKKPITTYLDVDPNLPTSLLGDELRIKQILSNLLSNAAKYTNEGQITLKVFFTPITDNTINLGFSVIDTGIGIRKEDLSKLFGSFKRLELNRNRNIQGSGLGLNIAKQLVDLMNGVIKIDSEYGKGSTFTVIIPQRVKDSSPIDNLQAAIKNHKKETTTSQVFFTAPKASILVVDDNDMNLKLMESLLKRTKINVDTVASGAECLIITKQKKYDIIFMDHMMPEMDGIEALHLLKEDADNPNKDSVVIALTANTVAGCREMYMEHGFTDYFSKPVIAGKLDELILNYLPKDLVQIDSKEVAQTESKDVTKTESKKVVQTESKDVDTSLYEINKESGMKYCMNSEDFYKEVLDTFCEQMKKYIPMLKEHLDAKDWRSYATIAHGIKSNAKTVGAENFAELSLKHELAGKAEDEEFILQNYDNYISSLETLIKKIQDMV